jgi:hypothetical protein
MILQPSYTMPASVLKHPCVITRFRIMKFKIQWRIKRGQRPPVFSCNVGLIITTSPRLVTEAVNSDLSPSSVKPLMPSTSAVNVLPPSKEPRRQNSSDRTVQGDLKWFLLECYGPSSEFQLQLNAFRLALTEEAESARKLNPEVDQKHVS